jgi:predicted DNA-binding protein
MQRTQIYLSEAELEGLRGLAQRSGRSQSSLIREAIDSFLEQRQPQDRLARLRQGRGLWAGGNDPFEVGAVRKELDRIAPEGA